MTGAEVISAAWAVASGAGLALLALFVLSGGPTRSRGALPFGLFTLAWAAHIIAVNAAPHLPNQGRLLYIFAVGMLFVIPFLLIEFASSFAPAGPRSPHWKGLRWATGALAVGGATALAFRPMLFLERTFLADGLVWPVWSYWKVLFADLPFILAFGVALAVLYVAIRQAPTTRMKNRTMVFLTGLGLYVAYAAANYAPRFLPEISLSLTPSTLYFAVFLTLALIVLALCFHSLRVFSSTNVGEERTREMILATGLFLPLSWGLIERVFLAEFFQSIGLWRLASVAIITYGLARWRIYDLPQRVRRAAASSTGFAGALMGGALVFGFAAGWAGSILIAFFGGIATVGVTAGPSMRVARRWLGPSLAEDPSVREQNRFARKVETYRAAVEVSLARGTWDEDRGFLEALQEDFGMDPREVRVIEHYAREAVIPVQEGDAEDAYERIRILGQGGAGQTWLARDRARDRLVVLKEPLERWHESEAMLDAARREARLAAKIRHPNVVCIEEVIEDDGIPILVMEHVGGGSLADLLREEGAVAWPRAVALTRDVARGVAAVHDAGILHRDVKPGNVLVTQEGVAKVSDFGIARKGGGGDTRVMEPASPVGTSAFMAPEVERGETAGSEAADVYGCAALLYTLLTGERPDRWKPLPERIPGGVKDILEQGLDPDPSQRFASAEALANALEELKTP